jgi:PAS domain S-box-containing protein
MPTPDTSALIFDLSGRILFAGTYFCDLVGVQHDQIAGRSYFDFVFPEDWQDAKKQFKTCKYVIPPPYTVKLRTVKGDAIWAKFQCSPKQNESGRAYAITATITAAEQPGNGGAEKS